MLESSANRNCNRRLSEGIEHLVDMFNVQLSLYAVVSPSSSTFRYVPFRQMMEAASDADVAIQGTAAVTALMPVQSRRQPL